jgi:hypothetical protein
MELKVQIIGNALLRIGQSVNSFVNEIKTLAEEPQVQAIAAEFPGGTTIDQSCIALCNAALAATKSIPPTVANAENAIEAIYTKLKIDIAQVKHNSTTHNIGYYIKLIGVVMEDLAARV